MEATTAQGRRELLIADGRVLAVGAPSAGALRVVATTGPSPQEIAGLGAELGFDHRIVALTGERHLRARADRFGEARYLNLRPARYDDAAEQVRFAELELLVRPGVVLIIGGDGVFPLGNFMDDLAARAGELELGEASVLHLALDAVVEGYDPVIDGLANDIDEIEDQVFREGPDPLRRIYELLREVIAFQRATDPTEELLAQLLQLTKLPAEERRFLRDAHERARHARERAAGFRALLQSVLDVDLALRTNELSELSIQQNEQMKKISSWGAIFLTPTLLGSIYGMNFRHMPELDWKAGYPLSLALMLALAVLLWAWFRRNDWL